MSESRIFYLVHDQAKSNAKQAIDDPMYAGWKVILTQDRLKELFIYDCESGTFTRRINIANRFAGEISGSVAMNGYLRIRIDDKYYYSHRLAWLYMNGNFPEKCTDHIDGNRKNNSISNLRMANHSENHENIPSKTNNFSGLRGAYYDHKSKRYYSKIQKFGKYTHLGGFGTAEEAHAAYVEAKRKLHLFNPELRK